MAGYGGTPYGGGPYGGGSGGGGNLRAASDSFSISDAVSQHGISTHIAASDTVVVGDATNKVARESVAVSDSVVASWGLHPQSTLQRLIPGVGGHATPRTRNPVNAPRYFKKSVSQPPAHFSYSASDSIGISDSATRSARPYTASTGDSFSLSDLVTFKLIPRDSLSISDSARVTHVGHGTNDTIHISDSPHAVSQPAYSSDSVPISDSGRGTPGRNNCSSSDSVPISAKSGPGFHTFDTITVITDAGAAGPVFFAGYDTITITDSGTGVPGFNRAFVFQDGLEILLQPSPGASIFQDGLEIGVTTSPDANVFQDALEVGVINASGGIFQVGTEVLVPNPPQAFNYAWWFARRMQYRR